MKYIDLNNYEFVPEEVKEVVAAECAEWDAKHGYAGKSYSTNKEYQLQLDTNASFSEDQTMMIINTAEQLKEVNELLAANNIDYHIADGYVFNDKRHGEIYLGLERVSEYTWCDFVRTGGKWDPKAAWTIETKATKSGNTVSGFHKADVVFVFYLDTKEIEILAPTVIRADRTDQDYISCGKLSTRINFKPITIKRNTWEII